jgi:hypothetical protein
MSVKLPGMVEINGASSPLRGKSEFGRTSMWTKIIVTTVLSFCLCATQDALAACVNCEIVKKPPFDAMLGKGPP